jgi:thiol peroxidase
MATTKLGEHTVHTVGDLPAVGSPAPAFVLTGTDFRDDVTSESLAGRRLVLNIFPSIDTGVCSASVRRFNELAASLENTTVVCASRDLPLAQARFCGAEGIDRVVMGSDFRGRFGDDYGVTLVDGKWAGMLARAVVVVDADGSVRYTELVPAIGQEPDYDAAVAALG